MESIEPVVIPAGPTPAFTHTIAALLTVLATGGLLVGALIALLRALGRTELVHYAGAAHRDPVAWHMCAEYLLDPTASEHVLKSRALKAAYGWDVTPEQCDWHKPPAAQLQWIPVIETEVAP
jgi:hypothetical protein